MKQTKFIFLLATMVALSFGFSSCSSDDDNGNPLVGTTWVAEIQEYGWIDTYTLTFTTENSGVVQHADICPDGETETTNGTFTYTFNAPAIALTISIGGESSIISGEVRGSTMTLQGEEGGELVFIRQ
jgi:hypothetical protein